MYVETSDNKEKNVNWSTDPPPDTHNNLIPTRHALSTSREEKYWLSLDKSNGELRYGKFFVNATTVLRKVEGIRKQNGGTAFPKDYEWLKDAREVKIFVAGGKAVDVSILRLPVTYRLSPFVVPRNRLTLLQLENGLVTVPANLPDACKVLYGNVAGENITLNDSSFPDFTRAIELSCKDGWCYKELQKKKEALKAKREARWELEDTTPVLIEDEKKKIAEERDKIAKEEDKMTYIRVTLGYDHGDSPGVPYVLEIWPSGHKSFVHKHGDACAVIKVLHGKIQATFWDSIEKGRLQLGTARLRKGDVTWLDPHNYQIHQLHNLAEYLGVCCTIQCYRFEKKDKNQINNFQYTDTNGECHEFTPSSDITFYAFRREMKKEWLKRMGRNESEIEAQLKEEHDEFKERFDLTGGVYDPCSAGHPVRQVNGT
ncbi:RmlC-like cupin domain-containing protein [Chaetomium tenue]|uniref:RmlC-like cupin domain-containing protein n=1 Tax=Chaetomium tenue TaxID=1854479 RepID=A0ACB7NZP2_9PEZI|nr:RmlC-like cupin domain-containing protein [Chaetomium globosum]